MKEESKRSELMKQYWWQMIQMLPSSYNQKRTVMLNYEVLANIYKSRRGHKLDCWREFCFWIETLPYSELITVVSLNDIPICNEIMEEANRRLQMRWFSEKALLDNGSNETLLLVIARGHAKQTASFMKGGEYDE